MRIERCLQLIKIKLYFPSLLYNVCRVIKIKMISLIKFSPYETCAIYYLHWFRTTEINFLLYKKNNLKPHCNSMPLLLTFNFFHCIESPLARCDAQRCSLVPKRFRGKRNSIPYPKFTGKLQVHVSPLTPQVSIPLRSLVRARRCRRSYVRVFPARLPSLTSARDPIFES